MDSLIDNRIFHINLFLILTLFIDKSILEPVSISDIKLMCGINSKDALKIVPHNTICKTISWYSDTDPNQADKDALNKTLKRAYFYNDIAYDSYTDALSTKNIDGLVDDLIKDVIDKQGMDILIFDNLYKPDLTYGKVAGYDDSIQTRIVDFFGRLKSKRPDILYGLRLRYLPDPGFDLKKLDHVVPLFVYPASGFVPCGYNMDQKLMAKEDPADAVEDSVKVLVSSLTSSKIYLSIRIQVQSRRGDDDGLTIDTYSTFCKDKPNKERRFCLESLSNFYAKGALIPKYKLAGAFVVTYDYDDITCKCGCGCFAATAAINAGIQGDPEPTCKSWTHLYKEREK